MIFKPQNYAIKDQPGQPFIDPAEIDNILSQTNAPTSEVIAEIVEKSLRERERLDLLSVAALLNASQSDRPRVLEAARKLKSDVYGNRIVLFAPLYVGNSCTNSCTYCTFRVENGEAVRKTLSHEELIAETKALEDNGHKRLILVYGESPLYNAKYIADTVRTVYGVHSTTRSDAQSGANSIAHSGEIRRVNINAAPLSVDDFRTVHEAGIGTYQIFQETYHPTTYANYHPRGRKSDYEWRLTAMDRAMEAGIDDVGLGALLGLHHWRFEIMALVRHTNHLEACFGVGPHTISFPRITHAQGAVAAAEPVADDDFIYAIAVLRLAVPYTGLILTAREPAELRREAIRYGVSQIDGGTKLEIGSYAQEPAPGSSQFTINDNRSLTEVIDQLLDQDHIPSFCTACYRRGRTGEHFMEFSVPGFIKRFCTHNAVLTLAEYICDYATPEVAKKGWGLIGRTIECEIPQRDRAELEKRLERVRHGERDIYY